MNAAGAGLRRKVRFAPNPATFFIGGEVVTGDAEWRR